MLGLFCGGGSSMVADAVVPVCLRLWRFAVPACSGVVPLGRAGTKFEIASSAIFLLANEFITGQDLIVDGGNWLMSPMVRTPNPPRGGFVSTRVAVVGRR